MAKPLACFLGRHVWESRVEGGERYKVCAACGAAPGGRRGYKLRSLDAFDPGGQLERHWTDELLNKRR